MRRSSTSADCSPRTCVASHASVYGADPLADVVVEQPRDARERLLGVAAGPSRRRRRGSTSLRAEGAPPASQTPAHLLRRRRGTSPRACPRRAARHDARPDGHERSHQRRQRRRARVRTRRIGLERREERGHRREPRAPARSRGRAAARGASSPARAPSRAARSRSPVVTLVMSARNVSPVERAAAP